MPLKWALAYEKADAMSNIIASGQEKLLVLPAEGQPIEKASDANDLLAAAMAGR